MRNPASTAPERRPTPLEVLHDPTASHWLKWCLHSALSRDPVDAVNDAEMLAAILGDRLEAVSNGTADLFAGGVA